MKNWLIGLLAVVVGVSVCWRSIEARTPPPPREALTARRAGGCPAVRRRGFYYTVDGVPIVDVRVGEDGSASVLQQSVDGMVMFVSIYNNRSSHPHNLFVFCPESRASAYEAAFR